MDKEFYKLNKVVQILLLAIPFVNLITEIVVRGSKLLKDANLINLVLLILSIITIGIFGWIDVICILLTDKLLGD